MAWDPRGTHVVQPRELQDELFSKFDIKWQADYVSAGDTHKSERSVEHREDFPS